MSDSSQKPRLVPHSRSPLHFMTECIRVREWELENFPAWADPEAVVSFFRKIGGPWEKDPFSVGIRERHAARYEDFLCRTRQSAADDLAQLAPGQMIPEAVIDRCAAQLHLLQQIGQIHTAGASDGVRRSPETVAAIASRTRLRTAFGAIFVTHGQGDLNRTAAFARKHTPAKDHHQTAQRWHARDNLGAIARGIGTLDDDDSLYRLVTTAENLRVWMFRAAYAWEQLKALPGYRRELNHERMLDDAIGTGQLGAWLDAPVPEVGERSWLSFREASVRLFKHVHAYHCHRATGDVSSPSGASRNGVFSAAS